MIVIVIKTLAPAGEEQEKQQFYSSSVFAVKKKQKNGNYDPGDSQQNVNPEQKTRVAELNAVENFDM